MPEVLYEEVIEVDERVVLRQDGCQLPRKDPKRIVTGVKHNYAFFFISVAVLQDLVKTLIESQTCWL